MYFYLITLISAISDLTSKIFMKSFLLNEEKISLIGDILSLKLVKNTGIAFSLPIEGLALKIITVLIIALIVFYYFKYEKKTKVNQIAFGLIVGGALGNGIERIFNSVVIDFINLKYFAIFNFADIFINIGVIILIINYLSLCKKKEK
ncbi:signal peptidase II [Candidatus Gracilibacteria bacterium]|nr:signal peptidase II [Candidatus Gracilibacteria bacterium]